MYYTGTQSPPETAQYSIRKCRFQPRPAARGPVGPLATGHRASWSCPQRRRPRITRSSFHLPPLPNPVRLRRKKWQRSGRGRRTVAAVTETAVVGTGAGACTAPRTRPRSGGPGPWARRLSATLVAWGTSRAGWCPSTGPRQAQHLFWLSTPTRTARCWSCEGRRKWCGPSNTTTSINNSFYNTTTITITTINITRTWCLMYPTVTITWSTNTWAPISGSLSSRC